MVYVFLADGFEEIEALTPVDILKRGGVDVVTVGVTGREATSSHNIVVTADIMEEEIDDLMVSRQSCFQVVCQALLILRLLRLLRKP